MAYTVKKFTLLPHTPSKVDSHLDSLLAKPLQGFCANILGLFEACFQNSGRHI